MDKEHKSKVDKMMIDDVKECFKGSKYEKEINAGVIIRVVRSGWYSQTEDKRERDEKVKMCCERLWQARQIHEENSREERNEIIGNFQKAWSQKN